MRYLVVCVCVMLASGCASDVSSVNGGTLGAQWHVPRPNSTFHFLYINRSTSSSGQGSFSGTDTVGSVDSFNETIRVNFVSPIFGRTQLLFDGTSFQSIGLLLVNQTGTAQAFTLPIRSGGYSFVQDTAIVANGFYLGHGVYIENAYLIGNASAIVGGTSYSVMQYRCVHNLLDTIVSPHQLLDTMEVDFAPDLGYFTRVQETRYYQSFTGLSIYQATAILDSVRIPK
jgi:hypothetical protein